jgi:hypothetical protein
MTKEVMKQALEKIANVNAMDYEYQIWAREALGQSKQEQDEPIAWFREENGEKIYYETKAWDDCLALYTTPQTKEWVGLNDDEMFDCLVKFDPVAKRLPLGFKWFAEAIEAKLNEKNET